MVCSDILLRRHDLIDRLPRLIWRVIEIGKRDERIRSLMHRDASRYVVMQWFAEWIHGPFPPESRNLVLDEWAASLLHTKILSLKEKQNGASQETLDTIHAIRDSRVTAEAQIGIHVYRGLLRMHALREQAMQQLRNGLVDIIRDMERDIELRARADSGGLGGSSIYQCG